MSTPQDPAFARSQADTLAGRLAEPRRFIQVVAGARQGGKTTLVDQVLRRLDLPSVFISADEPTLGATGWLAAQWERARLASICSAARECSRACRSMQARPCANAVRAPSFRS